VAKTKKRKYSKAGAAVTAVHDQSTALLFLSLVTAIAYRRLNLPKH